MGADCRKDCQQSLRKNVEPRGWCCTACHWSGNIGSEDISVVVAVRHSLFEFKTGHMVSGCDKYGISRFVSCLFCEGVVTIPGEGGKGFNESTKDWIVSV